MADELDNENYHGASAIRTKERTIMEKWRSLLELLERHKVNLMHASQLMSMIREADTIQSTIAELEVRCLEYNYMFILNSTIFFYQVSFVCPIH